MDRDLAVSRGWQFVGDGWGRVGRSNDAALSYLERARSDHQDVKGTDARRKRIRSPP